MPSRPPVHRPPGIGDRQQQRRLYDQTRDKQEWRGWYKTARWQRRREAQLRDEPLCVMCQKAGRLTPATVADHVERHNGGYDLFWYGPLQSLCAPCHSSVKQREEIRSHAER
ncbi:5-methylcytosine-specific restriction endonuclease McrA [Aquamicrobium lusatiense]|uniref:5-methylcytosine-specific restriction endonuclease McrA n=1 Tax=Aquamicrobium lusatiense TaxID=89772 RepID=A0A7W9S0Y6_9HYPH|nr:HNH endonuclease [Aquamicrobium lusatiense]MBB6011890.1 5-methylcytosine-specific restriction endonuclease McrA [Aquamicrobium lusatiense]